MICWQGAALRNSIPARSTAKRASCNTAVVSKRKAPSMNWKRLTLLPQQHSAYSVLATTVVWFLIGLQSPLSIKNKNISSQRRCKADLKFAANCRRQSAIRAILNNTFMSESPLTCRVAKHQIWNRLHA